MAADIQPLHVILKKNAESQMMYAFVDGAITANPELRVSAAIEMFIDKYGAHDLKMKSALVKFHRMRHQALRKPVFKP